VLVAHAAVEPALRGVVARGLEVDGTEPLLGGLLRRDGLRDPGRKDGGKSGG
jgi:hypothetical protein